MSWWNIVPGVGNIVSGIINARQGRKNVQDTIKYQKEAANLEYARNLEQWNRENEWNLPKNQMQRMREAGINPNLIAENAGQFGQAATSPEYNVPRPDYSGRPNVLGESLRMLSQFNNFRLQNAQINNTNEVVRQNAAKADLEEMRRNVLGGETEGLRWKYDKEKKKFMPYWEVDSVFRQQLLKAMETQDIGNIKNISNYQLNMQQQEIKEFEIDMWRTLQNENFSGTKFEKMVRDFFRLMTIRR